MNDQQKVMADARDLIAANLPQCCAELIEMTDTAVLPSGVVHRVALLLQAVEQRQSLRLAQSLITDQAIRRVAELARNSAQEG
jgi:hypothetical protein